MKTMKKNVISALITIGLLAILSQNLFASPRRDTTTASTDTSVLRVGATPVPHAELLNLIREDLAARGIELRIIEFTDYVAPNSALMLGDLDANFFQHRPYLESNPTWRDSLVPAFGVHLEPLGLYSRSITNIADLANNARIAIPNDPSNGGRALLLLQSKGFITVNPNAGLRPTTRDITSNPRNFRIIELEAAQLPRALEDVEAAVINGNFAIGAGFNPARDALLLEGEDSPYVNYVVVRRGNENNPAIQAFSEVLRSQKVRDYIDRTWNGSVLAAF